VGTGRLIKEDLGCRPLAGLNGGLAPLVQDAYQSACERCQVSPDLFMYAALTGETLERVRAGESVDFPLDRGQGFGIEVRGSYVVPYVRRLQQRERPSYEPFGRAPSAPAYVDGS
jgi:hypothetical protein